ncbi:MAG: zinc metallopeptidase [Oscillospiraceae bacterium]|nr:zinc metallopeptidase [Oscillospiraceae bacterium]
MYVDIYYIVLVVPMIILSIICQANISSTFNKYNKVSNARGLTGAEVARNLLKRSGILDVTVEHVRGRLTDHYDPRTRVLRLSDSVFTGSSVAALGVAAHETGHAVQHSESYGPIALRSTLVPVANIGSMAGPYVALVGFIFNSGIMVTIGILLFSVAVLFYLVTLPVEFNASKRALEMLERDNILSDREIAGSKKVLQAAALTYVASALVAVMSLARLVLLSRGRRRD